MARGKRESEWLVIKRCLALIRRLQRGPATRGQLLEAMLAVERQGADALTVEQARKLAAEPGEALARRLEHDLARIRNEFGVVIRFDRRQGSYAITDTWTGLLDLPDDDLATMAWLEETFGLDSPQHDEVHALLSRLRLYLGMDRRGEILRRRDALRLEFEQRDNDEIPLETWEQLGRALGRRLRIEFDYLSPEYGDGLPRRHVADPYEAPYFNPGTGHFYLWAWCQSETGAEGRKTPRDYYHYRLGRMQNVRVLPDKLPPYAPRAPRYEVVYHLAPRVARTGVSRPRDIVVDAIEPQADGGAIVRGTTESIFWAIQSLMHYRENCRVLGGPELLAAMRETVKMMAKMYAAGEDAPTDVGG